MSAQWKSRRNTTIRWVLAIISAAPLMAIAENTQTGSAVRGITMPGHQQPRNDSAKAKPQKTCRTVSGRVAGHPCAKRTSPAKGT
jgi:hypothetical protein